MTDYTKQEEQWQSRMAAVAQNGNTGEHYAKAGTAHINRPLYAPTSEVHEINERIQKQTEAIKKNQDTVERPPHYTDGLLGYEAIGIIASSMTKTEFKGYCLGNILKYRLRAGKKGDARECLKKSEKYNELYEQYSSLCHPDV